MMNIRTDLALEAKEIYENEAGEEIDGVRINERLRDDIKITDVKITGDVGEKKIGKPRGSYITVDIPKYAHYDGETRDKLGKVVSEELKCVIDSIEPEIDKNMTVLVVGLGNWNITPDSLGPKVVSKLMITRHLRQLIPDKIDERIRPVCAVSPGVLGITGMESSEIIRGIVDKIKPNLIICIDALASRKVERVNATIQISNTGISPGSGVANRRMELSEKTLGIPVIAIGVPTVVDAATMANDTIDLVLNEMISKSEIGGKFYEMLKSIDREEKRKLILEVLNPYSENIMVTPKDVDMVIEAISKMLSSAINMALQPELTLEEINSFIE
ncbi:MAG: GPR endopeptidase [Clostridium sp.]|uniref:GPR endopeptidase n=1 Tax=Clostridium sp. TaxID=1506 RepID=UPI0025B9FFD9|nr:GPR endopeptidase [Clostridium sp.]MCH3964699.1 GPR endopeptidase [Clostridium sp.]MCI1715170.1 GPR endopeptidase [Clostridium sp.]MCI1799432.1 GPR endopeptidase [Clostridium sp.]MCI1813353.1 GPR endopeptidase [Clostridium sp.]MCI1870244.1 GPR endopeptidase [Clostridium sp.]